MPTIKNMLSWNLAQCSLLKALVLYLYEWSRHGITPICWSCSTLCPTSLKPTWLRFGSRSFGSCCFFRVRTARGALVPSHTSSQPTFSFPVRYFTTKSTRTNVVAVGWHLILKDEHSSLCLLSAPHRAWRGDSTGAKNECAAEVTVSWEEKAWVK